VLETLTASLETGPDMTAQTGPAATATAAVPVMTAASAAVAALETVTVARWLCFALGETSSREKRYVVFVF